MNYKRINNCFFLAGVFIILLSAVFIFAVCFKEYFSDLFLSSCLISSILCTAFFYRFNNGLISIIRGKFGKPSAKNKKYVDYDKAVVDNIDELKSSIEYGEKSILLYKQNTREVYQIIKLSNRILMHQCFIENKKVCNLITDYSSAERIKKSKNDKIIYFNAIKSVTYRFSETNFFLPVIRIVSENHRYEFIGLFEKITLDEIQAFFGDVCNVKAGTSLKAVLSKNAQREKNVFEYNILCLISCISFPYVLFASAFNNDDKIHILLSLFTIINVIALTAAVLLAIIKADCFSLGFIENSNDKRKDISFLYLSLAFPILLMCSVQTVVNMTWYIILIVILALPITLMYFKKAFHLNKLSRGSAIAKMIAVICVFMLTSSALVSGINYTVPVKNNTQSYHIVDRYTVTAKFTEYHYVRIIENGEEQDLRVSSEVYESSSDIVEVEKTTGLLGITYLSKK